MGQVVSSLFGGKQPTGPDPAMQAVQHDREQRAAEEQAKADQLIALSLRAGSRRKSLTYQDSNRSATLG